MNTTLHVIGCMSGTSLDGLDLAYLTFTFSDGEVTYQLHAADTIPYPGFWSEKLKNADQLNGFDLTLLNNEYGTYIGDQVKKFRKQITGPVDLVSSHGHTIFHQPEKRITLQIGNGAFIARETGLTTVSDFRTLDVAFGGQGAPLVPIGDEILFNEYDACLNLGGFSNISFKRNGKRLAFDISPCNLVLNQCANLLGAAFDKNGGFGKQGTIYHALLNELNQLPFYLLEPPKSLGVEWLENSFYPVAEKHQLQPHDLIATFYQHIAQQIAAVFSNFNIANVLVTGGGAFNRFLIESVKQHTNATVIIPGDNTVNYKEAIIFGLLGALRSLNQENTMKETTGASRSLSSGIIHRVQ